jgi:hypothetical protein
VQSSADKTDDPVIGSQDELDIDIAMEDAPAKEDGTLNGDAKKAVNLAEDLFKDDDLDEEFTSSAGLAASSPVEEPTSSAYAT